MYISPPPQKKKEKKKWSYCSVIQCNGVYILYNVLMSITWECINVYSSFSCMLLCLCWFKDAAFYKIFSPFSVAVLCAERVTQMTKTYNDIEAVTHLLEEVSCGDSMTKLSWRIYD